MRKLSTPSPLPDLETLNMLLVYDLVNGKLYWKERSIDTFLDSGSRTADWIYKHYNSRFKGKEAGSIQGGYMRCMIGGVSYMVHRLIWKLVNGSDPTQIDHIDGDRTNNRIENLRDVSHQVNAKNRKLYENNKTGVHGISFHNRDEVWQVRIGVGKGKELHLGNFKTWDEAIAVRIAAQTILDYHENHGRS